MSTPAEGTIEKMKASMLSINSKMDKLIESQAALVALASVIVRKIVPDYPSLPNQSFDDSRSDPRAAEVLAAIEAAGGISEKTEAYLLSMNSKLDKGIESQTALTAFVKVLIQQIVCPKCLKKATDEAEKSLLAPVPPTGGSMAAEVDVLADGEAVGGDFLAGIEAGGIREKTDAYLLFMNSKLDKVVESQAAITDLVTVLIEPIACPDCLKQSMGIGKCPLAPQPPTAMSDLKAVGELTESLLKTKL